MVRPAKDHTPCQERLEDAGLHAPTLGVWFCYRRLGPPLVEGTAEMSSPFPPISAGIGPRNAVFGPISLRPAAVGHRKQKVEGERVVPATLSHEHPKQQRRSATFLLPPVVLGERGRPGEHQL